MIDWLIIYGIVMGPLLLLLNNHRLVVSEHTGSFLRSLPWLWLRCVIIAMVIIQSFHSYGILPYSYRVWWDEYFVEHSMVVWFLLVVPITLALYIIKWITFATAKDPQEFRVYEEGTGAVLLRTSMLLPAIWSAAFWAWILFSPWLPFFKCFLKSYVLCQKPWDVF
jgi:hypothetical protein